MIPHHEKTIPLSYSTKTHESFYITVTWLDEYLVLKQDEVDHCLIMNCNCCESKDKLSTHQQFGILMFHAEKLI